MVLFEAPGEAAECDLLEEYLPLEDRSKLSLCYSTTTRPAYLPQLLQTTCGSFFSPHCLQFPNAFGVFA